MNDNQDDYKPEAVEAAEPIGANISQASESANMLQQFIERVERLEEDKKAITEDIRNVMLEAKFNGFDVKTLRTVIKLRGMDSSMRQEQEAILQTYLSALGM